MQLWEYRVIAYIDRIVELKFGTGKGAAKSLITVLVAAAPPHKHVLQKLVGQAAQDLDPTAAPVCASVDVHHTMVKKSPLLAPWKP